MRFPRFVPIRHKYAGHYMYINIFSSVTAWPTEKYFTGRFLCMVFHKVSPFPPDHSKNMAAMDGSYF